MTVLSGAGKSTVGKVLLPRFLEMRDRPVILLDGDIVRRNLSSELNFSKEHRELNVRHIGFVGQRDHQKRRHRHLRPHRPYLEARGHNRDLISIDDPYFPPANPEVTIDTTQMPPQEAAQMILLYLEEQGYLR